LHILESEENIGGYLCYQIDLIKFATNMSKLLIVLLLPLMISARIEKPEALAEQIKNASK
jgi:hypothetical protein